MASSKVIRSKIRMAMFTWGLLSGCRSGRGTRAGKDQAPTQAAAQRLGRAEAGALGHAVDGQGGALEQAARGLEPHALDVGGRAGAGLGAKDPGEVTDAHGGAPGQRGDVERGV